MDVDTAGNVFVADTYNHTIRKITPAGVVTTIAGLAGSFGIADGSGGAARFNLPFDVAVDGSGKIYVADEENNTIRIGQVDPNAATLGNYSNISLPLSADTTVTPDAAPTNATSINVSTSTNFKGRSPPTRRRASSW